MNIKGGERVALVGGRLLTVMCEPPSWTTGLHVAPLQHDTWFHSNRTTKPGTQTDMVPIIKQPQLCVIPWHSNMTINRIVSLLLCRIGGPTKLSCSSSSKKDVAFLEAIVM